MEFCMKKVYTVATNKNFFIEVFSIGKEVHDDLDCDNESETKKFLDELEKLIDEMQVDEPIAEERLH